MSYIDEYVKEKFPLNDFVMDVQRFAKDKQTTKIFPLIILS